MCSKTSAWTAPRVPGQQQIQVLAAANVTQARLSAQRRVVKPGAVVHDENGCLP
jgi:hypothetical protein